MQEAKKSTRSTIGLKTRQMQQLFKQWSPLNLEPTLGTTLSAATKVPQLFSLNKYKVVPILAGRIHMDVAPDTSAATVLPERNSTRDSAMQNARKATLARALCAGKNALPTIETSASSA